MSYAATLPTAEPYLQFDEEDARIALRLYEDVASRFASCADELPAAQRAAQRAIDSYRPRDATEMMQAARIVSLSLTEMDFLRAAAQPDMDPVIKMRLVGYALRLEKAAVTTERLLRQQQRPAKNAAEKPAPVPAVEEEPPAPPDAVLEETPVMEAETPAPRTHPTRPAMTVRAAAPAGTQAYPGAEAAGSPHETVEVGFLRFLAAHEALRGQSLMAPPESGGG